MLVQPEIKVLDYLTLQNGNQVSGRQIARDTGLGKSTVSRALVLLVRYSFVMIVQQGRNKLCSVNRQSPHVARLRMAFNLLEIEPELAALKKIASKIVLFGSCAAGTDTLGSDVDLFVVAKEKEKAVRIAHKIKMLRPIQWVIKTPQEYVVLNSKEPVFAKEISRGVVLWEAYEVAGV